MEPENKHNDSNDLRKWTVDTLITEIARLSQAAATNRDIAAQAIAERDALAAQVVEMKEALKIRDAQISHLFRHSGRDGSMDYDALEISAAWFRLQQPIPIPTAFAAEALVRELREKAELLEYIKRNVHELYSGRLSVHSGKWRVVTDNFVFDGDTLEEALRAAKEAGDAGE